MHLGKISPMHWSRLGHDWLSRRLWKTWMEVTVESGLSASQRGTLPARKANVLGYARRATAGRSGAVIPSVQHG